MRSWVGWVVVAALLAQVGCYDWVAVNPLDATKLSGRPAVVQKPDGRLVELSGKHGVRVTLKDGFVHDFSPPADVSRRGDELLFRGGNEDPLRTTEDGITSIEAKKLNVGETVTLAVLGGVALTALIVGVVLATAPKSPSEPNGTLPPGYTPSDVRP